MNKLLAGILIILGFNLLFGQNIEDPHGEEDEIFSVYDGKTIRKIYYRVIDVSGPSVEEKNGSDTSWFTTFTNSLHFTTKDWVVRNYLLFKEGDILDPFDVSESERLLRESGFFLDARIKIVPTPSPDSVDVRIVTKDRWTLVPLLSFNSEKNSYAGIRDDNFLGFGHMIDATVTHDNNPFIGWGTKILYTSFNTAGTFTNITGGFEKNKRSSIQFIDLSRPFVSLRTRHAGGLVLQRNSSKLIYFSGDSASIIPFSNFYTDIWAGYSFPMFFGPPVFRNKTNIIVSGGINYTDFSERPYVSSDSNRIFSNRTRYLLSAGVINKRYYRDHYLQRFGPTEDIPIGGMFAFTWGFENNEFYERNYSGIEGVFSRRISGLGYLSLYAAAGGYYSGNMWEQKVYSFDALWHSRLFEKDEWRWRFLIENNYLIGSSRYDAEQIYLDTDNGLRGYEEFSLKGTSSALFKIEGRVFTPFKPLGFSIGANIFSDLGAAAVPGESLLDSKIYQAYGAGLRFTNESISEAQFEVALVFRPFTPAKKNGSFAVLFSSTLITGSRLFNFFKPSTIKYGDH